MGWFLNKLRPKCASPLKDLTFGSYCTSFPAELWTNDEDYYHKKRNLVSSRERSKRIEERFNAGTDVLHDFLTIGTLGSQPMFTETFSMHLSTISEAEEMTVNDSHVIDKEVKLLEVPKNGNKDVSTESSSDCNTNDLNRKKVDETETRPRKLKEYHPGTTVQWAEKGMESGNVKLSSAEVRHEDAKVKKKHAEGKYYKEERKETKTPKTAKYLIKRMLKKFHTVKSCTLSSAHDFASSPTIKKLNQATRVFRRKVHPENSSETSKFENTHESKIDQTENDGDHDHIEELSPSRSRERWIRTENYLVLEL